jgi:sporulation protein YpjB
LGFRFVNVAAALAALLFSLFGFGNAGFVDPAAESGPNSRLELETEALYRSVMEGNRQLAFYHIQQFQQLLEAPEWRGRGNPEGWEEIRRSIRSATFGINDGKPPVEWSDRITGVKLAVDALYHEDNPLWLGYEQVVLDDIMRLQETWTQGAPGSIVQAKDVLERLNSHLNRFKAAALLQGNPQYVGQLSERIRAAETQLELVKAGKSTREQMSASIPQLEKAASLLFQEQSARVGAPLFVPNAGGPSWQWTVIIGSLIVTVLTYAGWRQYRAERIDPAGTKR